MAPDVSLSLQISTYRRRRVILDLSLHSSPGPTGSFTMMWFSNTFTYYSFIIPHFDSWIHLMNTAFLIRFWFRVMVRFQGLPQINTLPRLPLRAAQGSDLPSLVFFTGTPPRSPVLADGPILAAGSSRSQWLTDAPFSGLSSLLLRC